MPASVKDGVEKVEPQLPRDPHTPARNDTPVRYVHPLLRSRPLPARTRPVVRHNKNFSPSRSDPLSLPTFQSYDLHDTTPPAPPPSRELTTVTPLHSPSVSSAASYVSPSRPSSSLSHTPLVSFLLPAHLTQPQLPLCRPLIQPTLLSQAPKSSQKRCTPLPSCLDKVLERNTSSILYTHPPPRPSQDTNSYNLFLSCWKKATRDPPNIFPPLHELRKGKSLVDLSYNSTIIAPWKNGAYIFNFLSSMVLGIAGSSFAATFYSLMGVYDTFQSQMRARILDPSWRKLFLGTIPNILALNIFPLLTQKILFLTFMVLISLALVYYFHIADSRNH
ncbi:hypothetical protein BS47DRAFT_1395776 [Hydnum rufescens UP504]|uniref:Uncharacterized protein n=1 Tax=Hydnum rufescens UP504 TaxID=1448309 RepID=A0A9P6AS60_9AGAM|nr:hypothetical protein BS47DRAFT_1395776 [Hydnum rufescens UP504]